MFRRLCALLLPIAGFLLGLPGCVAQTTTTTTAQQSYEISGAGGTPFSVDDDLTVTLGGLQIYADGNIYSGNRSPIIFQGVPGQTLHFSVNDTYGFCNGLDPLYLSCKGSSTYTLAAKGLTEACGFAGGNNGIVYQSDFTIPASLPGCTSISIASVEVTQAIQQYQTLSDLQASLKSNGEPPVPIIAGKPAVMRVYFSTVTDATSVTLQVAGVSTDSKTLNLQPNCSPTDQRTHNNLCPSMEFYFTPPQGTWTATLTLTDASGNQLDQQTLNITSRTTSAINLKGVSGCDYNATKGKRCGSASALLSQTWMTSLLMPTATVNASTTWSSVQDNLQFSAYDFTAWDKSLARQAHALYTASDALSDYTSNQWTVYFAIYSHAAVLDTSGMAAGIPSHGATGPDIGMDLGADTTAQTVAHETGHTVSLRHTNVPVPSPVKTPPGCYLIARQPGSYWTYTTNNIQSSEGVLEDGFNVSTQTIIDPSNTFDLMAYCVPPWISPIQYTRAIGLLNGAAPTAPAPSLSKSRSKDDAKPALRLSPPAITNGSYWQIGGDIDPVAGVTFGPVFTETIAGSSDAGSGTYSIQVLGAARQVLYTRYFTPIDGVDDDATVGTIFPNPYFSEWVPVTAGAASIAVMDPNGNMLGSVALAGGAPTVAITSPAAGFAGSNQQTISWTIQDADSTAFTSRVLYSPDGGTTWGQVSQTTASSDTVDFSQVPGSANGLIRVYVTDGVNTGSATSAPFNVPKKSPSVITIITPATGYTQRAADPVYLSGGVYDADDGILQGSALAWSSDVQGALGTGSPLSVKMQPGSHTITLTGTDSDGNKITATTKITLGGGGPLLSLTTNQISPTCVNATINATAGTQGASLTQVQYSVDGGMTYTTVQTAQLPLTFIVPGSGSTNLVARAYDASGQSAAQSMRLSTTATCVPATLSAVSGSNQSAAVGGTFAAPLKVAVQDSNGNGIAGIAVTFAAPSTGASATLSATSGVTASDGTFSVTATANATTGSYSVVASAANIGTTATFALSNTDFQIAAGTSSLTIAHGSSGTDVITVTPLGGFNTAVNLQCSGLPTGATCTFSPATLTPQGGAATSTMTITVPQQVSNTMAWRWSSSGVLVCCMLGVFRRRRRLTSLLAMCVFTVLMTVLTGCSSFTPFNRTVTVTASSGTVQRTATVALMVK